MNLLVLFMLMFVSTAEAANYYVSKQGADANSCAQAQSVTTPKLKISSGASCLSPGDTLFVKAGLYAEELSNVIPSGTSNSSTVTITAFPGDVVTIQPTTGMTGALTFSSSNQAYIVIDGINVDCLNASTDCVSIRGGAHHIKIRNSEVKNSPGVGVLEGLYSEFTNLRVHHHRGHGFRLNQPNNTIEHSEIYNNGGYGIYLDEKPGNNSNTIIRNNRIYSNSTSGTAGAGVMIGSGTNILVYNNIINSQSNSAGSHGIEATYDATNTQILNNTISNNPGFGIVLGANVRGTTIRNNIITFNSKGGISDSGTGTILTNNYLFQFPINGQSGFFEVTSFLDDVDAHPGDGLCETANGECTLRAAIEESNATPGPGTIQVPNGTVLLTRGTLNITDSVAIQGPSVIDGATLSDSIFTITGVTIVKFSYLTLQNGGGSGGGSFPAANGGGLYIGDNASVELFNVKLMGNKAASAGGGIYNRGELKVRNSLVRGNSVLARGGGILNLGSLELSYSTVSNNDANAGGGLQNQGTMTIYNSTVSENKDRFYGSGILNLGTATLNNVTIAFNQSTGEGMSTPSGGIYNSGTLQLGNTIVARNTNLAGGRTDCGGTAPPTSKGFNLFQDNTGCSSLPSDLSGDPKLGSLASNPGSVLAPTNALLSGSPAINKGNPAVPGSGGDACMGDDQRGQQRSDIRCDIGAYEAP
jgi:CSLREA domain-containing protein